MLLEPLQELLVDGSVVVIGSGLQSLKMAERKFIVMQQVESMMVVLTGHYLTH